MVVKKRAIIFGTGGLSGAYSAGFASELCKLKGQRYFDSVYGISVGTTIATFFVSDQPDTIENTWKNFVHGHKLVKPYNIFVGKRMLDLDYLVSLFKGDVAHLDVDKVMERKAKLKYAVIDYDSGKVKWVNPAKDNLFRLIMAACSMPVVRGPQRIGKKRFFDAGFVYGGIPELDKIASIHDEIIYVSNYPRNYKMAKGWKAFADVFFPIAKTLVYPAPLQRVFEKRKQTREESLNYMENHPKFTLIFPEEKTLNTTFSTSKKKIDAIINLGKKDARKFVGGM